MRKYIYIRKGIRAIWKIKKKKVWDTLKILFHFEQFRWWENISDSYLYFQRNEYESIVSTIFILWYRKIFSYLVVDHVPISSLKIKLQNFNFFFFIIVVVVTTVTTVRNKSPLTYLNTCTQQLVDRYYRFKPRSLCYENRIRTIHDHGSANEK